MKYMLLIATDTEAFAGLSADEQAGWMGEYFAFSQALNESGEMVDAAPLEGVDTATTVRVRAGEAITTDGPFAETKETIGGYYIVDVDSLDRAVELAAMIPDARLGGVEVRALVELPPM